MLAIKAHPFRKDMAAKRIVKKAKLIQSEAPRLVLTGVHPSPLSAYRGFFGSKPFSKVNEFLTEQGAAPIDWAI